MNKFILRENLWNFKSNIICLDLRLIIMLYFLIYLAPFFIFRSSDKWSVSYKKCYVKKNIYIMKVVLFILFSDRENFDIESLRPCIHSWRVKRLFRIMQASFAVRIKLMNSTFKWKYFCFLWIKRNGTTPKAVSISLHVTF